MARTPRRIAAPRVARVLIAASIASGVGACSSLIGADFDVALAPSGSAGGHGGSVATGGAGGTSAAGGSGHGGGASTGPDGGAGGSPPDAGACDGAACVPEVVVGGLALPWAVTTSGGWVYFTVSGASRGAATDGYVMRVPGAGGAPQVVAKDLRIPNQLVVGGGWVYWTSTLASGGVYRAPVDGSASPTLLAADQQNAIGIALDDTTLYWTAQGSLWSLPVATPAAAPFKLVDGAGSALLALNGASVLWGDAAPSSTLKAARKSDGVVTDLVGGIESPNGIVATDDFAFFTSMGSTNRIGRIDLKNPAQWAWIAAGQSGPSAIAVDQGYVYWTNFDGGTVLRVLALGAGVPEVVAVGQDHPDGIALDADYVYWTNFAQNGALVRLRRSALAK